MHRLQLLFQANRKAFRWLLVVLLVANIVSLFYIAATRNRNYFQNPYPLIDPTRSIIEQEHFLTTIEPLRQELRQAVEWYESEGRRISLYFEFLNTGANISLNQDARFWPASLSKLPTALAAMKNVQDGVWKLENELVLFEDDKSPNYGQLYRQPVGTRFTVETLLQKLILDSDNTAHRILIRNLDTKDYDEVISALGLEELFNQQAKITAKEYSRILRALYSSSYLKRQYSEQLLEWLSQTSFDTFLDAGIPETVKFAHKIGEAHQDRIFLDSGIAYIPFRPFLLTVIVEMRPDEDIEAARQIMKILAKTAYDYVANA